MIHLILIAYGNNTYIQVNKSHLCSIKRVFYIQINKTSSFIYI